MGRHFFYAWLPCLSFADPKPVSHLANGYQQQSRDSIRRGDGESDANRSSGLSEPGGNARFAGNAARYTNGHSATTGGKPIIRDSDVSMLASPPDDYSEDDTLSASVVARNLEQYNSLARSHHDSSYGPAAYHRQQAGEADGASARHQPKAPAANHPPSQQRAVAMAIQGLSAQQNVDERGASRQTNTQPGQCNIHASLQNTSLVTVMSLFSYCTWTLRKLRPSKVDPEHHDS